MTRNEQIREDRKTGMSYEKIAEKYMLTEDYVRDICRSKCKRVGGVLQPRRPTEYSMALGEKVFECMQAWFDALVEDEE